MAQFDVYYRAKKTSGLIDFSCPVEAKTKTEAKKLGNQAVKSMGYSCANFFKPKVTPAVISNVEEVRTPATTGVGLSVEQINGLTNKLAPGERLVLEHVPNEIYHATKGYGSTAIKTFMQAPAKLAADRAGLIPRDDSKFLLGTAVHDAVLLPKLFKSQYVTQPEEIKMRRGKKWDEFTAQHPDKSILTPEQYEAVTNMCEKATHKYPEYFSGGRSETSYWYRHENGVLLKARTDYEVGDLIIDLKTTVNASPDAVQKTIWNLGYYLQHCLYLLVTGHKDFIFVFIETSQPYLTLGPVCLDDDAKQIAAYELADAIDQIESCEFTRIWGGYPPGIQTVGVPAWKRYQHKWLI